MKQHLRHRRWLPLVMSVGVLGALALASSASAAPTYPGNNVGISPTMTGHAVPNMLQCGIAGRAPTRTHQPPLVAQGCLPRFVGPNAVPGTNKPVFTFAIRFTKPGMPPCPNGAVGPDVCLTGTGNSLEDCTATCTPYQGSISSLATIRFTDLGFCAPKPCTGPYTTGATSVDTPFGPVPGTCQVVGGKSQCSINTTANAICGCITVGKKVMVQIFRIVVRNNQGTIIGQQGIAWQ